MRLVPALAAAAALTLGAVPALAQDALTSGAPDASAALTTRDGAEAGRVEVAFDAPGVFLILPRTHLPDLVAAMLSV